MAATPFTGRRAALRCLVFAAALLPVTAFADFVSPAFFSANLSTGETTTLTRTVTISPSLTTGIVDIFFLADSTGSMGTAITSVRNGAAGIMAATSGLGDVRWGVGEYRDVNFSDPSAFVYRTNQDLTDNRTLVQSGIDSWNTILGGDVAEANFFALEQVAETVSWRPGSTRILAWFGDAPGHDPSNGSTEVSATAALKAANVKVEAIDVGKANTIQQLNYRFPGETTGQADRLAAATGGHVITGVDAAAVADEIIKAIGIAVSTYSKVCLDPGESPVGITAVVSDCITGNFDRQSERSFDFEVSYTGDAAGIYAIDSYASIDGGRVATVADRITVAAADVPDNSVPLPGTPALLVAALIAFALSRRVPAACYSRAN